MNEPYLLVGLQLLVQDIHWDTEEVDLWSLRRIEDLRGILH